MAHYCIEVVAYQLVFLLIYDVFLKRDTFFNWNRFYIITTALASTIIPLIKIDNFNKVVPQKFIINLPEIIIGNAGEKQVAAPQLDSIPTETTPFFTWETILYIGMVVAAVWFLFKIAHVFGLVRKNAKVKTKNLVIVKLPNTNTAFSFFNYVFLGEHLSDANREAILKHEIVHVTQKHTLDLLLFELLRIIFWFNPIIYMYQNRVMLLHEFIADAEIVKHQDKGTYYQNLLSQVFETKNMSFINPFFKKSLIKKRLIMLQKSKSKQVHLLKYALLIPMVVGMLVYSSSSAQVPSTTLELSQFSYKQDLQASKRSEEDKLKHQKYENFLKANAEYVGWVIFDEATKTASYSVHSKNETVPDGYQSNLPKDNISEANKPEYVQYFYFNQIPETEASKKQKQEGLLKKKEEYKDALEVPFAVIDQVPVFPGCEGLSNDEQRECMARSINNFVNRNYNTDIATENNLEGRQRISTIFKVDVEGNIIDVVSRAPHPALEAETVRVIKMLPKMLPGEHKGKKVTVPYSLPIVFQVAEKNPTTNKD